MAKVRIENSTEPITPPTGTTWVYVDDADDHLKTKDSNGTIVDLTLINNPEIVNKMLFTPQASAPTFAEGLMFYDNEKKFFAGYLEAADFVAHFLEDNLVRVVNNSGATIQKGKAVRHITVDPISGRPEILLSKADVLSTSRVMGVTANDILDGEIGYIVSSGLVAGFNTSGLSIGMPIYLSDTVAGDFTETAPEIATEVGNILISSSQGELQVRIVNNTSIANVGSFMNELTTKVITVNATKRQLANFVNESGIVLHGDKNAGTFTVPARGLYRIDSLFSISAITASAQQQSIRIETRVNNVAIQDAFPLIIGRNGEETSGTPFATLELQEGDIVSLWQYSDDYSGTASLDGVCFNVYSISIR